MSDKCQRNVSQKNWGVARTCRTFAVGTLQMVCSEMKKTSVMMKKQNFYVLGLGVLLIAVGMALMSGSGTTEQRFADENFSARRIRLAPWLCMTGYATVGVAVFFEPRKR